MALTSTGEQSTTGLGSLSTPEDTPAEAPPENAEGLNLGPAAAIAVSAAASALIGGIMAQRNAAKQRQFSGQQADISREFAAQQSALVAEENRKARQEANVQRAIGGIGSGAQQGAAAQGSALTNLARLFGGL